MPGRAGNSGVGGDSYARTARATRRNPDIGSLPVRRLVSLPHRCLGVPRAVPGSNEREGPQPFMDLCRFCGGVSGPFCWSVE